MLVLAGIFLIQKERFWASLWPLSSAQQEYPKVGFGLRVPKAYLDMVVGIKQDVGRLEVQVEQRRGHAVQEVHAHGRLVDDSEAQLPGQRLGSQELFQGPCFHVLHDQANRLFADAINREDVAKLCHFHLPGFFQ